MFSPQILWENTPNSEFPNLLSSQAFIPLRCFPQSICLAIRQYDLSSAKLLWSPPPFQHLSCSVLWHPVSAFHTDLCQRETPPVSFLKPSAQKCLGKKGHSKELLNRWDCINESLQLPSDFQKNTMTTYVITYREQINTEPTERKSQPN